MKKAFNVLRIIIIGLTSFSISCSGNIFGEMGDKTSDEALLQDIKNSLNDKDYAGAIGSCGQISTEGQTNRTNLYYCASAYAGRCGLDMIDLVTYMGNMGGADYVLEYLMAHQDGTAQSISDCDTAETLMQNIGSAAVRTQNENALMVLIEIQRLGILTDSVADESVDNEIIDVGHDSCTDITDTQAKKFGSAFLEIRDSGPLSGIPNGGDISTIIIAACTAINGVSVAKDFCLAASGAAMDINQLKGVRALISEGANNFGLQDCSSGTFTVPECLGYSTCL